MSWIKKNPTRQECDEMDRKAYRKNNYSFYLKKGETRSILFVDDSFCSVFVHGMRVGGKWSEFTCRSGHPDGKPCEFCAYSEIARYRKSFCTILDLTGYTKKDGEEVKGYRTLLGLKSKASKKWMFQKEESGGLVGKIFRVHRNEDKTSTATGDTEVFVKDVDLEDKKYWPLKDGTPVRPEAIKYEEVLEPETYDEQRAIMSRVNGASQTFEYNEQSDDDVPY